MAAVQKEKVNFGSLDRRTRRTPTRSRSTRMRQPVAPLMKRSGSMENLCTGTRVKEVPSDFPVHLDSSLINAQIMDIDGILRKNGASSTLVKSLEGQVTPSMNAKRRMSYKKRSAYSTSPSRELLPSEGIDSGIDRPEDGAQFDLPQSTVSIKLQAEDGEVVNKSVTNLPTANNGSTVVVSGGAIKTSVLRDSSISNDSGIGSEMPREIPMTTQGASTENSPTDFGVSDRLLLPSTVRSSLPHSQHFRERPASMLSQLCVMTVVLPANTQEGQKGRGAVLKFRFSPHTLIETLRVAILKVRQQLSWLCLLLSSICTGPVCMCATSTK